MRGEYPRVMIAAPSSGSGKTMLTCAILRLLTRRGKLCSAFKCGPDYIDPMFHHYALGVEGGNLDTFFLEKGDVRKLFRKAAAKSKISVIEGVMGYYDGIGGVTTRGSSYEVARATDTPVVLVLDGRGASLSNAAAIEGFLRFREDSGIRGVFLNRTSEAVASRLEPVLEKMGVRLLGSLPVCEEAEADGRYLGLKLPWETKGFVHRLDRLADRLEKTADLEALEEIAGAADWMETEEEDSQLTAGCKEPVGPVKVAVARDSAFCFYYQENLRMLEERGAQLLEFSPLEDRELPSGICGLILGGGYPELFACRLAENESMRKSILRSVRAGLPVLAECGGFLYLHREMEGEDNRSYPMVGVIEGKAFRTGSLSRFGYLELESSVKGGLLETGGKIRGHEFHYWESTNCGIDLKAVKPFSQKSWACMHMSQGFLAGFPHLYYPSNPSLLENWLSACESWRERGDRYGA